MSKKRRNFTTDFKAKLVLELLKLGSKKEMIDTNEGIQANHTNPSLNTQLQLLHISKTAHYYKPVVSFSKDEDIKLLNCSF